MKPTIKRALPALSVLSLALLSACGGGGSGGSGDAQTPAATPAPAAAPGVALTGAVTAPGGAIAFNATDNVLTKIARWVMADAVAAAPSGTFTGVGAGVKVSLIEIDVTGAQVGAALAETITAADGTYTLVAPADFVPAAKYLVRAQATSGTLDAVVTGTTVDVDPTTQVTKTLVLAAAATGGLSSVSISEVTALQQEVVSLTSDSSLRFTSAADAITQLRTLANASQEVANMVQSATATGVISGTVTDAAGAPLAGVKVIAADYGNWVTRSAVFTDAQGRYTLNVPGGEFILGAINPTAVAAASEWWTADGAGAAGKFDAARVTVGTTPVTGNFALKAGVTLQGKVTGSGAALGGVQVLLRDYTSDTPSTGSITRADGTWRVNVRPGQYTLAVVNSTGQPYASTYYGPQGTGVVTSSEAATITATADPIVANFDLPAGYRLEGKVTDPTTGPVTGGVVRIFKTSGTDTFGAFVNAVRTDLSGAYRYWLPPAAGYAVKARGQVLTADLSAADKTDADFTAAVGVLKGVIVDAAGKPVSQAKLSLYGGTTAVVPNGYIGMEATNSDGTFELYTTEPKVFLEAKIENGTPIGSMLFSDGAQGTAYRLVNTTPGNFALGTTTDAGSIQLPVGGVVSGRVTSGGQALRNIVVQVRENVTTPGAGNAFVATRTSSDGSYAVSLPYGSYKVRTCDVDGRGYGCSSYSVITVGAASLTKDFTLVSAL